MGIVSWFEILPRTTGSGSWGEESTVLLLACHENLRYHNSGLCLFESITKVPVSMEKSQIMNSVPASFINYCNNSVLVKTLFVLQVPE